MEVHHHAHTPRKKWTHYFWEFIMLFLAVFCGFLAEYQLEHKIERDREKQFMQTMAEDLKSDSSQLNSLIKLRKSRIRELDTLFQIIVNDEYLTNGRKVYELYEFPYWDILRFFPSDRTMQQLKNGGNLRLIRKKNVSNALIKYDVLVRNFKEYESLQVELATQINQHLEKLLDPLIIEKATKAFVDKQLVADTIVKRSGRMNLPPTITISKLADADKKIFLKYINQVKIIYLQHIRDNMSEKKLAEETLALVIKEYNIN
jgi:predicted outer membrane protein